MTISSNNSKLEALARARAWRDQRCATPPKAKRVKKTASESQEGFTNESPRRVPTIFPTHAGATVATRAPKDETKDQALARAREFAARLKEKKEHPKKDSMNDIPAVINIEDDHLSNSTPIIPTVHETDVSAANMEEMKRIATDMKKLSERLEAVTSKNVGCN